MSAYQRVLIGTDGSDAANTAVEVAGTVAARLHVPATIVTVWKGDLQVPGSDSQNWAEVITKTADAVVSGKGVKDVTRVERTGSASEVLVELAVENPNSLLVIGARGLSSTTSRLAGSTSNNLSHHSPVDVLFVQKKPQQWGAVGLATDGSATSKRAVAHGYELAQALGARAFLVTAAKNEDEGNRILAEVEQEVGIDASGDGYERDVITGVSAADALVNAGWKYDLLVVGNRGMSAAARLLGSVANKVTHESDTNLLLVNSTGTTA